MTTDIQFINPSELVYASRFGFSHECLTSRKRTVHVGGQTAVDREGRYKANDDLGTQAKKSLENLAIALAGAGATSRDVVSLRVYVVALDRSMFPAVAAEVAGFFGAHDPPPATWVGVSSLLSPTALIEIECVASCE